MYASDVKRLQILIEEDLDAELDRVSKRTGRSKGAVVRDAVRRQLRPRPPVKRDALWEMVGKDSFEPVSPKEIDEIVYDGR